MAPCSGGDRFCCFRNILGLGRVKEEQRQIRHGAGVNAGETVNELEFKHHLKDMVHGHHHPEEHDWNENPKKAAPKKAPVARKQSKKGRS